jgi:NADPH-dependent F420 reductase
MLAFLGGTGPEGLGLATRLAHVGEEVIIGSRSAERAADAAAQIASRVPGARVRGMVNGEAAVAGEVIFLCFPYAGQADTLPSVEEAIGEKMVINVIAPIVIEKGRAPQTLIVPDGSAAQESQRLLPRARVASAFQIVDAHDLLELERAVEGDVIVCGHAETKPVAMALAEKIPNLRAVDGGPLSVSRLVEDVCALLIGINRRYRTHTAIKILGLPERGSGETG